MLVDLVKKHGIEGMLGRISVAARYGSVEAAPRIFDNSFAQRMEEAFDNIASGEFPKRLNNLSSKDVTALRKRLKQLSHPLLEKCGRKYSE